MTDNPLDGLPVPLRTRLTAASFEYNRVLEKLMAVRTEVREYLLPETRSLPKGEGK